MWYNRGKITNLNQKNVLSKFGYTVEVKENTLSGIS